MDTYWQKQTAEAPLFEDLIWSRPQHKATAGKLLIIGSNSHGFAAVAGAYAAATRAGIGTIRLLLPDALQKMVGVLPDADFAPSTPSGSFGRAALDSALELADWADAVLLAGDFGKNSETTIFLESISTKYKGQLILCGDSLDNLISISETIFSRSKTCLVPNLRQLQLMASSAGFSQPVKLEVDLIKTVEVCHELTGTYPLHLLLPIDNQIIAASGGQVVTTKLNNQNSQTVVLAAAGAVWWLQNSAKPLAAITGAVYDTVTTKG